MRHRSGRKTWSLRSALIVLILAASISFAAEETSSTQALKEITIIYTNDLQGHIFIPQRIKAGEKQTFRGGLVSLSGYLKELRRLRKEAGKSSQSLLILDAGDTIQGIPESDASKGEAVIRIMNLLGYDAMTIGNHEYHFEEENLKRLASLAQFPLLGANILDTKAGQSVDYARPYIIKEVDGIRIGIIGILTPETKLISRPEDIKGLEFGDEITTAKKYVKELRNEGIDVVILLTHIGFPKDMRLASTVRGIDVIIGGHSQTPLRKPRLSYINHVIICQTSGLGRTAGKLDLTYDTEKKEIIDYQGELINLDVSQYKPDEKILEIAEASNKLVAEEIDRVIGEASISLTRSSSGESTLGNWITDVMRETTGAQIALHNNGGIRADLPKGEITKRDLYKVSPFGNTLVTMELTGAQIKKILEQSLSRRVGMLQISGLKVIYDKSRPEGFRIVKVKVGRKSLKLKKSYRVVTNSFLASGGNEYQTFKEGRNIKDTGIKLLEAETEYVKKYSPIRKEIEGRIVETR